MLIAIIVLSVVLVAAAGRLVAQRMAIGGLRSRVGEDEAELDRLRSSASDRDAAIDVLRTNAREREQTIDRLHDAATRSELEIEHLRSESRAAAAELDDLRAVRDVLTPPDLEHDRPGIRIAATFEPHAGGIGGDFYLVTGGPHGTTVLVVGDVVGKGLQAARRATFVRTAIALAAPYVDDPSHLLDLANEALLGRDEEDNVEFVTAACVVFEPDGRRVTWASAGHPPPLWLDEGGQLDSDPGLPLGVQPSLGAVTSIREDVAPGSGVLLFTDGLTEARGSDGEQYGPGRAGAALRTSRGRRPDEVLATLSADLDRFETGTRSDDLCLLAVRFS